MPRQALHLFDTLTIRSLLTSSSSPSQARQSHAHILKTGLSIDTHFTTKLLSLYTHHLCFADAELVLDSIPQPDLFSFSTLIYASSKLNRFTHVLSLFSKMLSRGLLPDSHVLPSAFKACTGLSDLKSGKQVHGIGFVSGFASDSYVQSSLVHMYVKCNQLRDAHKVVDEISEPDVFSWSALVSGYAKQGCVSKAKEVFDEMGSLGIDPNLVTWNGLIAGFNQSGCYLESIYMFKNMHLQGFKPDGTSVSSVLPSVGDLEDLNVGIQIHGYAVKQGIELDKCVVSALIDMYGKCACSSAMSQVFDEMDQLDLGVCNALVAGLSRNGLADEALMVFKQFKSKEMDLNVVSWTSVINLLPSKCFTCILSACSQSGLTEEGQYYFNSMCGEHGIEARVEHYACMVTLLGRAGKLEEAYSIIKKMPYKPDACVWGALLSSCRVHKNMSLGEIAANKLFKLEPKNPGNYILLSNIYASKGKWDEVDKARDMMKSMGLRKNPGCSWIEVKNKVHVLLAGDKSHPQMTQIIEKLHKFSMEMKKSGSFPITDFVLQDVEEQDKEQILCGHSEKLAVVFGLLNTRPGSPLRVIKNLRICGDCHAVIKFISNSERRNFVLGEKLETGCVICLQQTELIEPPSVMDRARAGGRMDIKLKFICGELEGLNSEYFVLLSCIWRAFICWVLGAATTRLSNSEFKILWLNFYLEEGKSERSGRSEAGIIFPLVCIIWSLQQVRNPELFSLFQKFWLICDDDKISMLCGGNFAEELRSLNSVPSVPRSFKLKKLLKKLAGSVGFENGRLDIKTDSAVAVSHHRAPLARIIQDCRNLSPCHCGSDK
ncbi:Pentatricopeptide repeat-containing protein [Camellia lanceoleosa]|uniref:Pentatricopeptide repeat-containing protein n=1 Tax=Camellia lanceoleosa TaxID=1840588 RepID=A0ACC0GSI4_9ERIC|nr:Pentatricopeptide repeat-containing protein [Camellia lanceoleosa]